MATPLLRIGTRGSPLALIQARELQAALAAAHPELAAPDAIEIVVIRTTGDSVTNRTLAAIGAGLDIDLVAVWEEDPATGDRSCGATWERGGGGTVAKLDRDGLLGGRTDQRLAFEFPARSERGVLARIECFATRPQEPGPETLASLEVVQVQLGQLLERRRAEHSIDIAFIRHRATLQAALDCVITIDHRGRVLEFNPAAERTLGIASVEAVGREMAALIIPPDQRVRHRIGLRRYLETGEVSEADLDGLLAAAAAAGELRRFSYEPPKLSELFMEAVTAPQPVGPGDAA